MAVESVSSHTSGNNLIKGARGLSKPPAPCYACTFSIRKPRRAVTTAQ